MGASLWPARDANPKGFFEDQEINYTNEEILAAVTPQRPRGRLGLFYRHRPVLWQRWLTIVPLGTHMPLGAGTAARIERQTAAAPYCFKDPRFCYTLPAWRPALGDAAFLCVFRSPAATVASILKDCREAPYLRDLKVTRTHALRVWTLMYRHVLEVHQSEGDWLFLHYDQILDGSSAAAVDGLLGAAGDWAFPDPSLRRSVAEEVPAGEAARVYRELCGRAGYRAAKGHA